LASSTSNTLTSKNGSVIAISKLPTSTVIVSTTTTYAGKPAVIHVSVAPSGVSVGTPSGSVVVSDGARSCTLTLAGGLGSCSFVEPVAGYFHFTAIYQGDSHYLVSQSLRAKPIKVAAVSTASSAPRKVQAKLNQAGTQATITWQAPKSDGGSPITGYDVSAGSGFTCHTTSVLMCVINNLKPNVKYAFSVVGINAFGRSAPGRALTLVLVPYVDGSPQLTPPMIELLKGLAQEMVGGNFHNVTVEGYTSSTGSFALNQALGIRRGQVAAAQLLVYLAADGVSGISIKVIGKGDVVFLTPDHTNPTNRQTDITVN